MNCFPLCVAGSLWLTHRPVSALSFEGRASEILGAWDAAGHPITTSFSKLTLSDGTSCRGLNASEPFPVSFPSSIMNNCTPLRALGLPSHQCSGDHRTPMSVSLPRHLTLSPAGTCSTPLPDQDVSGSHQARVPSPPTPTTPSCQSHFLLKVKKPGQAHDPDLPMPM